ncbi:ketopantoate reductase family protein [Haladaptatus sp. QDMS2]|uniref:ketopantoate reductase family protein n=1 Tax=Haladaptatus sp. QDMS2 TaxID=3033391 RepID=UPI0023E8A11B|nr:ketopantoate reductase family protein [Haladaptatus sp. QDMS2]
MKIVVFGAGSLGSLVGGLLAREHDVTLVGRDPHMLAVRESGLQVGGEFDFTVYPKAETTVPDSADLVIVTVKAFDTAEAAHALADCPADAVLTLQNGMGNEETLAATLGCSILAGTCTYGAVQPEPGHVFCTGVGDVVLGLPEGGSSTLADRIGEAFSAAGIVTTVATDMPLRRWEKLAVNAGINPVTALTRIENGDILDGPARETAVAAARETARVAQAQGVNLSEAAAVEAVEAVARATAENTSSMFQDIRIERRTEIDAINGYVVAHAGAVSVPVNATLANLVKAWEKHHARRA